MLAPPTKKTFSYGFSFGLDAKLGLDAAVFVKNPILDFFIPLTLIQKQRLIFASTFFLVDFA